MLFSFEFIYLCPNTYLENLSSSLIEVFVFELYSIYTDAFQNYSTYEQEQLTNALDTIQLVCINCFCKTYFPLRRSRFFYWRVYVRRKKRDIQSKIIHKNIQLKENISSFL